MCSILLGCCKWRQATGVILGNSSAERCKVHWGSTDSPLTCRAGGRVAYTKFDGRWGGSTLISSDECKARTLARSE